MAATAAFELQAQQPPPAWKQGQPSSMADSKLAPHASPMTVTPVEKIHVEQAQGAGRLQGRDLGARHARRAHDDQRRQGHHLHRHARDRQGLRRHRQGRQARAQGDRRRTEAAERRRLQERRALCHQHRQALRFDGIEDKLDAPQPTDISEAIKLPPSTHHNWKFAAVGPDNKLYISIGVALQHLRDRHRQVRTDPAAEPRRLQHRDRGARRAQLGRLRLASADQGAVVHRQRPRLGGRRGTGRGAEPGGGQRRRRLLRLPLLPRQRHP